MDYPCGKFSDCSFSCFGSILRTNRHTQTHTDTDERFTPATFIGVSKQNADKRTDRGLLEAGQKMLMLQLEDVLLQRGVRRPGYPLQSCFQCRLLLFALPLAFQVRARRQLLSHPDLCQSRFLQNTHNTHLRNYSTVSQFLYARLTRQCNRRFIRDKPFKFDKKDDVFCNMFSPLFMVLQTSKRLCTCSLLTLF